MHPPTENPTSRRQFLGQTLTTAAAAGLAGAAGQLAGCGRKGASLPLMPTTQPGLAGVPLTHRAGQTLKTDLRGLKALALDAQGRLLVGGEDAIAVFDPAGRPEPTIPVEGKVTCLATDANGDLYVGVHRQVRVYDARGTAKAAWGPPSAQAIITAVACTGDTVYVADFSAGAVWRYSRDGTVQGQLTGAYRDPAGKKHGFYAPSPFFDLAAEDDGTLWVVNPGRHRAEHYDAQGQLLKAWGHAGSGLDRFSGCCNPTHLALWPASAGGEHRFITSEKGTPRVKLYDADGRITGVVAGPDSLDAQVQGLDVLADARGRVFVLSPQSREVQVFDPIPA